MKAGERWGLLAKEQLVAGELGPKTVISFLMVGWERTKSADKSLSSYRTLVERPFYFINVKPVVHVVILVNFTQQFVIHISVRNIHLLALFVSCFKVCLHSFLCPSRPRTQILTFRTQICANLENNARKPLGMICKRINGEGSPWMQYFYIILREGVYFVCNFHWERGLAFTSKKTNVRPCPSKQGCFVCRQVYPISVSSLQSAWLLDGKISKKCSRG